MQLRFDNPQPALADPRFAVPVPFYHGPGFGLGDLVQSVTSAVGVQPCTPCEARKKALNQALRFRGWQA